MEICYFFPVYCFLVLQVFLVCLTASYREGSGLLAQVLADNIAAILFSIQPAGFQSLKMENLRKDYRARIREDLLTEAASDTNKVKFFQEQFQVSQGFLLIVRDT